MALYLAQRDIPVLLLEKEPALPVDLRASTFHPPSLEMIADLGQGVIEEMLEKGLVGLLIVNFGVLCKNPGNLGGQRAVDIDRKSGDLVGIIHFMQNIEKLLGATESKRRN